MWIKIAEEFKNSYRKMYSTGHENYDKIYIPVVTEMS